MDGDIFDVGIAGDMGREMKGLMEEEMGERERDVLRDSGSNRARGMRGVEGR
jgi:hypothetical protein